jgi:hypothetical protein
LKEKANPHAQNPDYALAHLVLRRTPSSIIYLMNYKHKGKIVDLADASILAGN